MATASELFLVRFSIWLVRGGMMTLKRLGQDDKIEDLARFQPDRHGRFRLPLADRLNARPDDFRHKGGGIKDKPEQERSEFRAHVQTALEIEPHEFRDAHLWGAPASSQVTRGKPMMIPSENVNTGKDLSRLLLAFSCPSAHEIRPRCNPQQRPSAMYR